jgi:hypothetical protein
MRAERSTSSSQSDVVTIDPAGVVFIGGYGEGGDGMTSLLGHAGGFVAGSMLICPRRSVQWGRQLPATYFTHVPNMATDQQGNLNAGYAAYDPSNPRRGALGASLRRIPALAGATGAHPEDRSALSRSPLPRGPRRGSSRS